MRKSLDFIIPALDQFFISGNITLVKSSIDMTSSEFEARKQFERPGEKIKETRDMSGQAPYMINVGLSYENSEKGWDGGIFYNVNGRTLTVVGGGIFPDVYSQPFHSLNLNMNKEIGESRRTTINISVSNILGDKRENFFTAFKADDQYFSRLNPGTSFSVGLKYNLIK